MSGRLRPKVSFPPRPSPTMDLFSPLNDKKSHGLSTYSHPSNSFVLSEVGKKRGFNCADAIFAGHIETTHTHKTGGKTKTLSWNNNGYCGSPEKVITNCELSYRHAFPLLHEKSRRAWKKRVSWCLGLTFADAQCLPSASFWTISLFLSSKRCHFGRV